MKTEVWQIDPEQPDAKLLAKAGKILRRGGLVAMPTETVYGLAANALDAQAAERIYAAKGRTPTNPLIVHVLDLTAAIPLTREIPEPAHRLAAKFWPGPLTLVLQKSDAVPSIVTAGGATIALRVPSHPVARGLLQTAGVPLAAPSANRSNALSPTRADHVLRGLDGRIDLVLDAGPAHGGIESTVLDVTCSPPRLLRPGLIVPADLEAIVGPIDRSIRSAEGPLRSPGMLKKHYAPRTPLEVSAESEERVRQLVATGQRVGWLRLGNQSSPMHVSVRALPSNAEGYAAGLFAALHELDEQPLDRIVVEAPPEGDAWLGIHDRLSRACHE